MPTDIFQPITNHATGETFCCIQADETAYIMEWTVAPKGYVPFEHIHLVQDEVFKVQEGRVRLVVEGKTHIVGPGENITVPKGSSHIAYNDGSDVLRCIVEYRPGLDFAHFQRCFLGLIQDRDYDSHGTPTTPKVGFFIRRGGIRALTRPTNIPPVAYGIGLSMFYLMGRLQGWEKLYRKYTGQ